MYQLVFYVPESHLEQVKTAVFNSGAGRIGAYDHCCWQVRGEGQFQPLAGSQPWLGTENQIERLDEYRVELVCADELIQLAIDALKKAHPYEEPAYSWWRINSD